MSQRKRRDTLRRFDRQRVALSSEWVRRFEQAKEAEARRIIRQARNSAAKIARQANDAISRSVARHLEEARKMPKNEHRDGYERAIVLMNEEVSMALARIMKEGKK